VLAPPRYRAAPLPTGTTKTCPLASCQPAAFFVETPMNEAKNLNLIAYVRVSTDEQSESGVSLDVQAEQIRATTSRLGHTLIHVITDAGQSAETLRRPGMAQLFDHLKAPEIDGVIVAKLDRLTRSVADWCVLLRQYFGPKGTKALISCSDHVDVQTAAGRFMLLIQFALAQLELEKTTERTQSSVEHKRQAGERIGTIPYGSMLDPNGRTNRKGKPVELTSNGTEQAVILLMNSLHNAGFSAGQIALQLNERQVPSRTGRPWSRSTVDLILKRASQCPNPTQSPLTIDSQPLPEPHTNAQT
jgi:site-specific DNA recombinase